MILSYESIKSDEVKVPDEAVDDGDYYIITNMFRYLKLRVLTDVSSM